MNGTEPQLRPSAAVALNHKWFQGSIPTEIGPTSCEEITKLIETGLPEDIIKRLCLRTVAYCYSCKLLKETDPDNSSTDHEAITKPFLYIDKSNHGAITADELFVLSQKMPEKDLMRKITADFI